MPYNDTPTTAVAHAWILIRLPEVLRRTGLSRSEWYRRIADGSAPAQIKLGKHSSAWVAIEIDQFIANLIAARDERLAA